MSALVEPSGQPADVILVPDGIDTQLRYADNETIRWSWPSTVQGIPIAWSSGFNQTATSEDQPYRSIRSALGGFDLVLTPRPTGLLFRTTLLGIPPAEYSRYQDQEGVLRSALTFEAYRYVVSASIPLRVGSGFTVPSRHAVITAIDTLPDGVRVRLRDVWLTDPYSHGRPSYFLLTNTRLRRAVFVRQIGQEAQRWLSFFERWSLYVASERLEIRFAPDEADRVTLDEQWLKDAQLVWVVPEPLGTVTSRLQVDDFSLRPRPKRW